MAVKLLASLVQTLRYEPVKLLAETLETHEKFDLCQPLGFDYYQGYFFSKPSLMVDHRALDTNKGS